MLNLKLAICDDQTIELERVMTFLNAFSQSVKPMEIYAYTSSLSLYNDALVMSKADVFLLDIVMPEMTGIELAKHIRSIRDDAIIIFFTTSTEFALKAYGLDALQYLTKPVNKTLLYNTLNKAIILLNETDRNFFIQTSEEKVAVRINEIEVVEYKDHHIYFYTGTKCIKSKNYRIAFEKAVNELFEHENFVRTHRAFLINMKCIQKMTSSVFEMASGQIVPISRTYLNQTRKAYMKFILKG